MLKSLDYLYIFAIFSNYYIYFALLFLGVLLFLLGLFFKLGVAPFHSWLPDVYEGSPLIITVFFMTVVKLSHFLILVKWIFIVCLPIFNFLRVIFLFFGFFSIFLGSILALNQFKIKRIFSYSSISHVGFILLLFSFSDFNGLELSFFYMFFYIIMVFFLFSLFILIIRNYVNYFVLRLDNFLILNNLGGSLFGLSFIVLLFSVVLFSFIGVPPFIGFFIKYIVFFSVLDSNFFLFNFKILTLFFLIIFSVVSSFYYLRLIIKTFTDNSNFFLLLNVKYTNDLGNLFLNIMLFYFFILVLFFFFFLDVIFGLLRCLLFVSVFY